MTTPLLQFVGFSGRRIFVRRAADLRVTVQAQLLAWVLADQAVRFSATRPALPAAHFRVVTPRVPTGAAGGRQIDLITGFVRAMAELLGYTDRPPTISPGQSPALPPTPPGGTPPTPPGKPGPGAPAPRGQWDGESDWKTVTPNGITVRPGPFDVLWRASDDGPETLFTLGLPAPGGNFGMVDHQLRADRAGTDDAFYGCCPLALFDGDQGPLMSDSRYLVLMVNAYGVPVESKSFSGGSSTSNTMRQEPPSIVEHEVIVHIVPPWKIAVVLDLMTGQVHSNDQAVRQGQLSASELARRVGNMGRLQEIRSNRLG